MMYSFDAVVTACYLVTGVKIKTIRNFLLKKQIESGFDEDKFLSAFYVGGSKTGIILRQQSKNGK